MIYIGIDNGVTGSIGIIYPDGKYDYHLTPIKVEQSYTKTKQNITRIDFQNLTILFAYILNKPEYNGKEIRAFIERPMVNPGRFKATASALRSLEATIIVLENLSISYQYIDSKEWQKILLPAMPIKTKDGKKIPSAEKSKMLKNASLDIGKRLFPKVSDKYKSDADGMLIAEYCRRFFK